jgi:hypothetical protein
MLHVHKRLPAAGTLKPVDQRGGDRCSLSGAMQ